MKSKHILFMFALLTATFAFVACGDDEPNIGPYENPSNDSTNVVPTDSIPTDSVPTDTITYTPVTGGVYSEVVGTYQGWTHLVTAFLNKNYANDIIQLTLAEDSTLTATYHNETWGTATITGIRIVGQMCGDIFLEGGEGSFDMNNPRDGSTQEIPCKWEDGQVQEGYHYLVAQISAYMEVGHGDMTFTFQTGEMPTEDE